MSSGLRVMCTFVLGEVAFLLEFLVTNSALVRFVTRMDAFVSGEVAFVLKAFITERAWVKPFLRMCSIRNGSCILLGEAL